MVDTEALKASVALDRVIGQYLELKQQGPHWVARCPFHQERTPSFTVTPEKGIWKCFGCGANGDAITFIERMENVPFQEAVQRLADGAGWYNSAAPKRANAAAAAPQPQSKITAVYKYLDEDGKLLYEICRIEPGKNGRLKDFLQRYVDDSGKFVWKKHPRQVLYRLPEVKAADVVFSVEGERDVETLFRFGLVATTNAGGCKAPWLPAYTETLRGKSVVVIPDNDEPGLQHAGVVVQALKDHATVTLIRLPVTAKGADVTDWVNAGATKQDLLDLVEFTRLEERREQLRGKGLLHVSEIEDTMDDPMEILNPSVKQCGVKTGIARFDEMTQGLHRGDLVVIGARPSMGKTALALNIAMHAAWKEKKRVALFSLEMSRESLLRRLICAHARVDSHKHRSGFLTKQERQLIMQAYQDIKEMGLFIDEHATVDPGYMRERLLQQSADLVIVDYLQLMRLQGKRRENRTQEVGEHSRGLKLLARELRVPIIALSQLSRALESRVDKRPQVSDLRESGDIEQDADVVAFVFREEVYRPDRPELKGTAELIVAKQRDGPVGVIKLTWLASILRFEGRVEDYHADC